MADKTDIAGLREQILANARIFYKGEGDLQVITLFNSATKKYAAIIVLEDLSKVFLNSEPAQSPEWALRSLLFKISSFFNEELDGLVAKATAEKERSRLQGGNFPPFAAEAGHAAYVYPKRGDSPIPFLGSRVPHGHDVYSFLTPPGLSSALPDVGVAMGSYPPFQSPLSGLMARVNDNLHSNDKDSLKDKICLMWGTKGVHLYTGKHDDVYVSCLLRVNDKLVPTDVVISSERTVSEASSLSSLLDAIAKHPKSALSGHYLKDFITDLTHKHKHDPQYASSLNSEKYIIYSTLSAFRHFHPDTWEIEDQIPGAGPRTWETEDLLPRAGQSEPSSAAAETKRDAHSQALLENMIAMYKRLAPEPCSDHSSTDDGHDRADKDDRVEYDFAA